MQVYPLNEGSFSVDGTKEFIPFDPLMDDPKSRPGSLFIHVQPFLVVEGNGITLLDTGLGKLDSNGELSLHAHIKKAGYQVGDVKKVIMSHLHGDHAGGLAYQRERDGPLELSFPRATHFIQADELAYALSDVQGSYPKRKISFLLENARIEPLHGNSVISEGVTTVLTGAHSPFHQVVHLQTDASHYFFGGDVLPEGYQMVRNYAAKYDFDGRKAMELRKQYAKEAAAEGWVCLYYHDSHMAMSKVGFKEDGGVKLLPV